MTTDPKRFGPLIGGCVGGSVGYLAGLAFGPVAAVGMFFLGAYVGYDFKTAAKIFGRACTSLLTHAQANGKAFAHDANDFLQQVRKYWYAYTVWAAATALCFNFMIGDMATVALSPIEAGHFTPHEHLPYTVDLLKSVVTGESQYFPGDSTDVVPTRLEALVVIFAFGLISSIVGAAFLAVSAMLVYALAIIAGQFAKGAVSALKTYRQWPLTLAWMLFWVLALPTVGVAWVVAASLTSMFTVRRLACGIVTVATGISYLLLVPVPTSAQLIGAAAIGCGLACGLCAHCLFALIGIPAVIARLRALRERTIASFCPLPALPWWDVVRGKREPCA